MPSDRVSPSLQNLIEAAGQAALARTFTSIPGRVESYDGATQKVDVKPLVKRVYIDEEGERQTESLPVVPSVPVLFPGGGGYRVTFPVQKGDLCLLVVSSVALDRWLSGDGGEVDPEIDDGQALHNAVALVGLRTFGAPLSSAPTDEATIGKDDGVQIHFEPSLITAGDKAGAEFVALANLVLSRLQAIVTAFNAHFHNDPVSGVTSAPTVAMSDPASVAASQFKAK